jgi:hypothetical protein
MRDQLLVSWVVSIHAQTLAPTATTESRRWLVTPSQKRVGQPRVTGEEKVCVCVCGGGALRWIFNAPAICVRCNLRLAVVPPLDGLHCIRCLPEQSFLLRFMLLWC